MSTSDLRKEIASHLQAAGLERVRNGWQRRSQELTWLIEVDLSPHSHRLGIDVGCSIQRLLEDVEPDRTNACQVQLCLENLPLSTTPTTSLRRLDSFGSVVIALLDPNTEMSDEARRVAMKAVMDELVGFVSRIQSESDLATEARAGTFRSGFVDRRARDAFSAWSPPA
ncbi:MAG: hypothetical protein KF906_12915 [Actinobacteria bacterium]|nr:hypothetical protein [Actinomycetota bacterium]